MCHSSLAHFVYIANITCPSSICELQNHCFHIKQTIGHFTVMDESKTGVHLVLIQTFLLYYVNQVVLILASNFHRQCP